MTQGTTSTARTARVSTGTASASMGRLRKWLADGPLNLMSITYLVLPMLLVSGFGMGTNGPWSIALTVGALAALLGLDYLDRRLFGEAPPPTRAGIVLLALRFLLIEGVAYYAGIGAAIWLYALVPGVGARYFGPAGAYATGALMWCTLTVRLTLLRMPFNWSDHDLVGYYVSGLVMLSFLIVFIVTVARLVWEEKAGRTRVERLLGEVKRSHGRLSEYSAQAIAAVEDRNRIAGEIHRTLGQHLAVINVLLEKALAFRDRDPQAAEQAVHDGKQVAGEALHDVRRSVGALRSYPVAWQSLEVPVVQQSHEASAPRTGRTALKTWLAPRPFDIVTAAIYIGVMVVDLGWADPNNAHAPGSVLSIVWGAITLCLLALDRLDYRLFGEVPPVLASVALILMRFALITAIGLTAGWWYTMWLFPLLIYTAFSYFGGKGGYVVTVLTAGLFIAFGYLASQESGQFDAVNMLSSLALAAFLLLLMVATARTTLGERAGRQRAEELIDQIKDEHRQLGSYSEQTVAAMQERNHLAREIHDGLGHYLTVINVQLEKALAFRAIDPQAADRAIRDAGRLTSEALQEVRVTVGSLQLARESFSLRPAIEQLVGNMAGDLSMDVRIEGSEEGYSGQSLVALYRAAQEGLTNIHRHSGARRARLRINLEHDEARLYLNDDGRGFDAGTVETTSETARERYGLQGVHERLQLVGGSMEVQSKAGAGTSLYVTVPRDPHLVTTHSDKQIAAAPETSPAAATFAPGKV